MSKLVAPKASLRERYNAHVESWKNCQRCPLHRTRKNTVLMRGNIPADVAMIGEAPGDSEDVFGLPFKGVAGQELDSIISEAWSIANSKLTYVLFNLIACLPSAKARANRSSLDENETWEPTKQEIKDCSPRVTELLNLARPKLVVCLGDLSYKHIPKLVEEYCVGEPIVVKLPHPARILRLSSKSPMTASRMHKQTVIRLVNSLLMVQS